MKRRKLFVLVGGILVALLIIGGGALWWFFSQPLYQPGMVRAERNLRAPLVPPAQTTARDFWQMESDIRLYHFARGTGRNVLIIHGGPGYPFAEAWPGLEPLTGQYQFHYYDQRGSGQSTRPFDKFTSGNYSENLTTLERTLGLGAQIADIERIRQIVGEERLILVGHSFGGFLAALYAAEFPERVEALILVAPAEVIVMPPPSGGLFEQVKQRLPAERRAAFDEFLRRYLDYGSLFNRSESELVALNDELARFYSEAVPDLALLSAAESGGWMVHAMYLSMGQTHDYRPALQAITAPTLILHGANDLQPESGSRLYAEAVPNARFEVIPNAAHFAFVEQPEAFARVIGDFLRAWP